MSRFPTAQWHDHLRRRLAHTDADQRKLISLGLPPPIGYFVERRWVRRLQPAAVLVPVRNDPANPTVILTVRAANLRAHGGQISFPGGRMEIGEDFPNGTALREAQEEIGLDPAKVDVIGYLDDYPTITKFRVTPVVGLVEPDAQFQPDPGEVAEVFEVPLSLVMDRGHYRARRFPGRLGLKYFELHYRGYRIWGATAGMLYNLQSMVNRRGLG